MTFFATFPTFLTGCLPEPEDALRDGFFVPLESGFRPFRATLAAFLEVPTLRRADLEAAPRVRYS